MAAGTVPELVSVMGDAAEDDPFAPTEEPPIGVTLADAGPTDTPPPVDDMSAPLPGLAIRPLGVVTR